MKTEWTVESLKAFEIEVANIFNSGAIKAPVHLSDGNEGPLLKIFEDVEPQDWVFCSWRSHYQALLKGVPKNAVLDQIMQGHSISLAFPGHNFYSSAIVGGQVSIALGVALGIKRREGKEKVWCFIGDMTSETGIAQSSIRYAENFDLPIIFVIEDNNVSVMTDTRKTWGNKNLRYELHDSSKVLSFKYKSAYPHAGAGVRVQF
jgi:pyruvate dehydrogenase E1 component alpha subunit